LLLRLGPQSVGLERMRAQDLITLPVTRSDGVLLGVIRREDAEQALESLATA